MLKVSSHNCGNNCKGFSLVELMVSTSLGLVMSALLFSTLQSFKEAYRNSVQRLALEQDLRISLNIVGGGIRQAGEGLTGIFPAIEVIDGARNTPDQIVLRRAILQNQPTVCATIAAGSVKGVVMLTNGALSSGCSYSTNGTSYSSWHNHRISEGGSALAYIFNSATKLGEFFTYSNEMDSGDSYYLVPSSGNWTNQYPLGYSNLHALEESTYSIENGELVLVKDQKTDEKQYVAFGLTDLQAQVHLSDGSVVNSFQRTSDWTQVRYIEITLTAEYTTADSSTPLRLVSQFFPRNSLSS
jgi:prepilin-type N-terminal cleavage/methylation domain-containing protein